MIAAFFDIDGTIYRNALLTEHFKKLIKYELLDQNEYIKNVAPNYKLWEERKGDYDNYLQHLVETYVRALKDLPVSYNNFISDQVVSLKGNKVYTYTRSRIEYHKKNNHLVVFISGSPDFLVSRMAKKFGADRYYGSIYGVDKNNEKLSGEITRPMWDSKHKKEAIANLVKEFDIDMSKSFAYGDTNGDFSMLSLVGNPTAINPSKELLEKLKSDEKLNKICKVIVERKDVIYNLNPNIETLNIEIIK